MKLHDLLAESAGTPLGALEITDVTSDSRHVCKGCAFVCIEGTGLDGHDYAEAAVKKGARVIVANRDTGRENQIIVSDTRESYAVMCSAINGHAHKQLKLIGVTGTNGKTTVTYLIKAILECAGFKTGLIGTNQSLIGDESAEAANTTPDARALHGLLGSMLAADCEYVVMEVSSHALVQKRVFGLRFDTAVFTNLTQDHLDYHGTMENYLNAKRRLFEVCDKGVFNYDDRLVRDVMRECQCECISFSALSDEADYTAKNISYRVGGVDFELVGVGVIGRVHFATPGKFSVYNALAAGVAATATGMPFTAAVAALSEVSGVKGRVEIVPTDTDFTVVIDYAHSPDALENVISTLSNVKKGRLVTLFGCGGDRDREKRPVMARI
ncbi:MAG TPA: UDP-N-acetylmuramoyl-L-alanyl-D-glutamate--2,6-diaminopimelate ligase, partial [Ruminococcaceae bacterium]|nr:UDP-N-acetylmuramoyl-L-alanyl-D-glutamate--2,6-diaminopimelate ligase [Oscillospiraceae bacterium]